jgi:hypothetical protein
MESGDFNDLMVVVSVQLPPRPDITPSALEVTQGIQNLANEIPLIAGKITFARFYVRHDLTGSQIMDVTARLRLTRNTDSLDLSPVNPGGVITVSSTGGNRANRDDSFLFFIPPRWRSGEVTFEAQVLPPPGVDRIPDNNAFPLQIFMFDEGPGLCVDFVRLHLHPNTYSIDDPSFGPILRRMLKVYPISDNQLRLIKGGTISPYFHWLGTEWDLPADGSFVIARLWKYNLLTNDPSSCADTVYFGMAHPSSSTGGGSAWTGHSEAWGTMISSDISPFGAFGGTTMAHEIGHNYDLIHINCPPGQVMQPVASYPYPPCSIGEGTPEGFFGFDVDTQRPIAPAEAGDMMSYAQKISLPRWTSAPTYCALLANLQIGIQPRRALPTLTCDPLTPLIAELTHNSAEDALALPLAATQQGEFLATNGIINTQDNTVVLETFYRLEQPKARLLATSGQQRGNDLYDLVLLDETGQVLRTHTSSPAMAGDHEESPLVPFAEILPYDPRTSRIVLKRGDIELASRSVSPHSPEVRVLSPNGGEVWGKKATITWQGSDADGDELQYTVQYSADGGETWRSIAIDIVDQRFELLTEEVPGSHQALIRVIASDGVNTGMDTSDGTFTVPSQAAPISISIASPTDGAIFPLSDPVLLLGYVFDMEGITSQHDALSWFSDRDGFLGSGPEIITQNLSLGIHRILFTTDDNSATASVNIEIVPPQEETPE